MSICTICLKSTSVGISQRHRRGVAGRRWLKRAQETKRTFSPNIQSRRIVIDGESLKVKLCAKCMKRIKKYGQVKQYSNVVLA